MAKTQKLSKSPKDARDAVEAAFKAFNADRRLRRANEATTRVELIDRVMRSVGWPSIDAAREVPSGTGTYLDYELSAGREPWMVVEAKRREDTFELAVPGPRVTLQWNVSALLSRGGKRLREVMVQAANYCNSRGVPLACVTNGFQWLFFRGLSTKQRPWPKGVAVVFAAPDEVLARFDQFLGCIGQSWAGTSYLPQLLDRPSGDPPTPPRIPRDLLIGRKPTGDSERIALLRSVNQMLFTEIYGEDRREMLERCYVQPGISSEFEKSIQRLLKDSARPFGDDIDNLVEGDTEKFVVEISRQELAGFKDPVLVVGHVGVGKTTFLNRSLASFRADHSAFCALVDLEGRGQGGVISATAEEHHVASAVLDKLGNAARTVLGHRADISIPEREQANPSAPDTLRTLLRDKLTNERALGEKLWTLNPAAWAKKEYELIDEARRDPSTLLVHFIRHLRARFRRTDHLKYPILVVLDNLDQASNEYQRCIYGLAQRIARNTPAVVIICIREDTYAEGVEPGGFLTSSPMPLVFHVAAPPLDRLLRQRVRYGENAEGAGLLPRELKSVPATIADVCALINASLLAAKADSIALFASLAGHNIRDALALVRALVIGSSSAKLVPDGSAAFAFECLLGSWGNEALRARGFANCFDADPASPPLHALRVRLLAYYAWAHASNERPFLEVADSVLGRFSAWGYPVSSLSSALRYLLSSRLLRASDWQPFADQSDLPKRICITASGYVHLSMLLDQRSYRAAMACVTSWYNQELADRFVSHARAAGGSDGPTIGDIAEAGCVEIFNGYLAEMLVREDAILADPVSQQPWAREVRARSSRIVPTLTKPRATIEEAAPGPPIATSTTSGSDQLTMAFIPKGAGDQAALPTIPRTLEYAETVWIPRILWALEWARRGGLGLVSAADIARLLREHGDIDVPHNNVARAFRDLKQNKKATGLWAVHGHRYQISDAGVSVLNALVCDEAALGGRGD